MVEKSTPPDAAPKASEPVERSLKGVKLFAKIPDDSIHRVEEKCRWIDYVPGQTVLELGDDTRDVYFIVKGKVRIMNAVANDREVALGDLLDGDHFGEMSALVGGKRSARVIGSEHCLLAVLSRDDFLVVLNEHPQIAVGLLQNFVNIIRSMNERVFSLSTQTPHQRVYAELLRIAQPNPRGDGSWMIEVAPAHAELAGWAGTEKHEVASAIGGLVRDGVIERKNKSFLIKDHPRLRVLANM